VLFEAAFDSFGADSFSLNWTTVASGKVKYLAVSLSDENAFVGGSEAWDADLTLSQAWRARSAIALTAYDSSGTGDFDPGFVAAGGPPQGYHFVGGGMASYPSSASNHVAAGFENSYQYQQEHRVYLDSTSNPHILQNHHFGVIINTLIGGLRRGRPDSGSPDDYVTDSQFELDTWDSFVTLQAEAAAGAFSTPLVSGNQTTFDVTGSNPEQTGITAILFMAGGRDTFTNGVVGACGFGVWTPGYQGSVFVDGNEQSLYQSSTRGWTIRVDAGGAIAGTADAAGTTITLDCDVDGGPSADTNGIAFLAFGESAVEFIPQIYRLVRAGPWKKR